MPTRGLYYGTFYGRNFLSGASHNGRLLASPTNVRLGWKGLPRSNTLAYYKKSINYGCKKVL
jgi:hypothetical protein